MPEETKHNHLTRHTVNLPCTTCQAAISWLEDPVTATCSECGVDFESYMVCDHGHHVCPRCRELQAREAILAHCLQSAETDPYLLYETLLRLPTTAMHGPEHHLLLPAALLTAYANVTNRGDLSELLQEAQERSLEVPGGVCGFWGVCGAAIGSGIFMSIITEASPFTEETWTCSGVLAARSAAAIALQGGPRCCKRDGFTALLETIETCRNDLNIAFPVPSITCSYFANNEDCHGIKCQFFPNRSA